jgi:hypothetical protein
MSEDAHVALASGRLYAEEDACFNAESAIVGVSPQK